MYSLQENRKAEVPYLKEMANAVSTVSCVVFVVGASRSKVHDQAIRLRAPLDCAVFSIDAASTSHKSKLGALSTKVLSSPAISMLMSIIRSSSGNRILVRCKTNTRKHKHAILI